MNKSKIAAVAVLAMCPASLRAQDTNQVSVQILSGGQSSRTVAPGQISLQLDVRLSTSIGLAATRFSLDCSAPSAFVYAGPGFTVGSPFTVADMALVPVSPPINDGVSLADYPTVTFFRNEDGNYAPEAFPSVILSYHLRSNGALPANTSYTFTLTEVGDQPFWLNDAEDGAPVSGKITVGTAGAFTLHVSGNEPPGFLPFCGSGTGPVFIGATLMSLWLISARPRRR